jgi:hypothetical protein
MPIRPENRHFYSTPAFEALRDLLRARSGNRCERCKAPNGERVFFADQYDPSFVSYAMGAASERGEDLRPHMRLANAINEGNPNWTPYEVKP